MKDKTIKDKLREELQKIKVMNRSEKIDYIWAYYKLHIIGLAFGLIMGGMLINDLVINPSPRSVLTIAWMGGFEPQEHFDKVIESLSPLVVQYPNREAVHVLDFFVGADVQQSMAQRARFTAMSAAGELDIIIGNLEDHDGYFLGLGIAPIWGLKDLRPILAEAGISQDDLLFYDGEEMLNLAFAIPVEGSTFFNDIGISTEYLFLGVLQSSQRDDAVISALRLLWQTP